VGLAMAGVLQPVWAAAVMAGSSIVVVLNSLRLERLPDPVRSPLPEQCSAAAAETVTAPLGTAVPVNGEALQPG
jgi:P-type Cu2+ transporter